MCTGSFLTVLVTSYLFVSSGAQRISTCPGGHVDVEENKTITIRCEGFKPNDTVVWNIGKTKDVLHAVVTCKPMDYCKATNTVAGGDRKYDNRDEYSELYLNGARSQHNHVVVCEIHTSIGGKSQSLSCTLNVTAVSNGSASPTSTDTTVSSGSASPSSSDSMCLRPTTDTAVGSHQDKDQTDVPVEAIVGGAVAAVVVIVIVVVLVVVICKRNRNRERSGKDDSLEQQVHYNPENGTGVALEPSQNADDDTSAGPPEFGIYAFPGGDEPATIPDNTPAAEEDDVGMYAAPKQDVYAAVDKSKPKKNKPAASDHLDTSQAATVTDEYAVVNKASKKKEASNSTGLSEVHIPENNDVTAAPVPYIYAQVDKTFKPAKTAISVPRTPDEEGATYA